MTRRWPQGLLAFVIIDFVINALIVVLVILKKGRP